MTNKYKIGDRVFLHVYEDDGRPCACYKQSIVDEHECYFEAFEIVDIKTFEYTVLIPNKQYHGWPAREWNIDNLRKLPADSLCWNIEKTYLESCSLAQYERCKYCFES